MITRHKITQMYHEQLVCDKCMEVMPPSKYNPDTEMYEATCPHCGSIIGTLGQYPRQSYSYELEGTIVEEAVN